MIKAKYIIGPVCLANDFPDGDLAICFPEVITHANMARRLLGTAKACVAAGFFYVEDDKVHVYGESTSIGVKSRKGVDEAFIRKALGFSED